MVRCRHSVDVLLYVLLKHDLSMQDMFLNTPKAADFFLYLQFIKYFLLKFYRIT